MGASYSFICCSLVGGALSYPDNESPLLPPIASRPYPDKLKIFGGIAAVGFLFFMLFYSACQWSLDYCGFIGVSSSKNWVFSILGGWMLGFGVVGLIYAFLRRSDDYSSSGGGGYGGVSGGGGASGAGSYNPMMGASGATTQPAISMI
mmetsp:Transcript_22292/g.36900  ORF Transcript_22292/g.36900 Transcript_22292/m.36900 type:complete len:148 (-) Transcript_22292:482-925(-)|eukprot:CAMPEP_0119010350 /NCGR_PEP_ID=MMETSP1176-20130426/4951_1 /TAXON_ID=265551 /ORGANISM="Synedropsis recta cf, Strain CCMP1620" /LENGTH=147 /DNA_ID=CAMNT_0006962989 /DNA_START=132 /DNA_END=575 /DNA_ORIENTATION=-